RMQVATLALELRMGRQADPQVEVARLGAAGSHFAFARHAHARAVGHARGNTDVHRPGVAILFDRQPPRRAVIRILERELDFLLHVAPGAGAARPAGPPPSTLAGAAKEGLEEIGKRVLVAEHLAHLVFGHRPEAAALRAPAAAELHVPAAELRRIEPGAAG